jgi:hypothetical protein
MLGNRTSFSRESKYYPLHVHLSGLSQPQQFDMEFGKIEEILGQPLPVGARSNTAWWGNSLSGHSQSRAWLLAGWRVVRIDLRDEQVTFARTA